MTQSQSPDGESDRLVFDSPCKTRRELAFAIEQRIHVNLDNWEEFDRAREIISTSGTSDNLAPIGFRINPLVGAGRIQALSVSTADSKFGVPMEETSRKRLVETYVEHAWLTSIHVHVGSGGMGAEILTKGIQVAVEVAKEVNNKCKRKQIRFIDIGGGLPANYESDKWGAKSVPTFQEYADHLRREIPDLFSGYFERVLTEFGQSVFAKTGFLAAKIEFLKELNSEISVNDESDKKRSRIAVTHFGADCCVRQAYTTQHPRRIECYRGKDGAEFDTNQDLIPTSIAGPLCFQGDFVAKDLPLPAALAAGDFVVLKDAGANTLALFSRHCSRLMPPVFAYSSESEPGEGGNRRTGKLFLVKEREGVEGLGRSWGKMD